ncbi:sigma-70 family RNA polymerase sigma factor [Hippea maritima]|uniref:RNA polymerase, sigma 28 subunit, FliA/WhiG n=1 Tax=Hippea maritima (strain ATCC 700847 / DSM 10411 / MH2) TaxID=760142 RepID=F2LVX0_HIPMA|nr:FliA/WhiG family RNA polymerase sigma factor [Hippea maritima]AEA33904.1 RNA polymerase, sigma 28 subunit, FliA/WhiG [Hippea maritima DSM 10411]
MIDKEEIIQSYYPIVRRIVKKTVVRMPEGYDEEDFVQIGMMGLLKAIENWDENKSLSEFKSYANTKIRGYILDKLRSIDPVSRYARDKLKKINMAYRQLMSEGNFNPTDDEIAERADMSIDEFNELLYKQSNSTMLSIDEAVSSDDGDMVLLEVIENKSSKSPLAILEEEELKDIVKEALKALNETEITVLSLYYYEDFNMKEIASLIGKTESRISQIKTKALLKIRAYVENKTKMEG